jgi:hypothetical protein
MKLRAGYLKPAGGVIDPYRRISSARIALPTQSAATAIPNRTV